MTRVWLRMATSWSEGPRGEKGVAGLLFTLRNVYIVKSCLKKSHEQVESLNTEVSEGTILLAFISDHGEPTDKAFLLQLQQALLLQAVVLLGISTTLTSGKVAWQAVGMHYTLGMHYTDNFTWQVIDSPTRRNVIKDLVVTNASELIWDIRTGGSQGCSYHTWIEFILCSEIWVRWRVKLASLILGKQTSSCTRH